MLSAVLSGFETFLGKGGLGHMHISVRSTIGLDVQRFFILLEGRRWMYSRKSQGKGMKGPSEKNPRRGQGKQASVYCLIILQPANVGKGVKASLGRAKAS